MAAKVPFWRAASVSLLILAVLLMAWEYAVLPVADIIHDAVRECRSTIDRLASLR